MKKTDPLETLVTRFRRYWEYRIDRVYYKQAGRKNLPLILPNNLPTPLFSSHSITFKESGGVGRIHTYDAIGAARYITFAYIDERSGCHRPHISSPVAKAFEPITELLFIIDNPLGGWSDMGHVNSYCLHKPLLRPT